MVSVLVALKQVLDGIVIGKVSLELVYVDWSSRMTLALIPDDTADIADVSVL
jgi:hypothetical protein